MKLKAMTFCTRVAAGATARDLTDDHLKRQLDHVFETVLAIRGEGGLSDREPVVRMWRGYEHALCIYGMLQAMEYGQKRGLYTTRFWDLSEVVSEIGGNYAAPPWARDKDVMRSHRSALARMYPNSYGDLWPGTPENMPYVFPFLDEEAENGYELFISKTEQALMRSGERRLPKSIANRVVNLQ